MTPSTLNEVKFWQQAKRIIRAGYGQPCKEFNLDCAGCKANLVVSWIDNHIALIKWSVKKNRKH